MLRYSAQQFVSYFLVAIVHVTELYRQLTYDSRRGGGGGNDIQCKPCSSHNAT